MKFPGRSACLAAVVSLLLGCATPADVVAESRSTSKSRKAVPAEPQGEYANFAGWKEVAGFIDQMAGTHGFDRQELDTLFRQLRYVERAIQLVKPAPPGRPKNWRAYRARFVEPSRIASGVAFWNAHSDALLRAEQQYGVPVEIIVGIIGVETVFGRNTGNFRVMDVLTTLAFDYPDTPNRQARMGFFKRELENVLLLARESGMDPLSITGSYAGAIGWPQFMPGSIRNFAVDFDGDGRVDLIHSPVDAIGSVANFLVRHGWKAGEPLVFPATIGTSETGRGLETFAGQGLEPAFRLDEIRAAGVTPTTEPPADILYGLVDLQNGGEPTEYWLGTANFFAITKYNRSFFYAMSVIELGNAVRAARRF